MPHAHLAAMATGVWTWARYSWMTLEALGFQCFTCRAPCPSHRLPEPKPESPSNPQNAVFSSLRQSTDLQATLLVFNSHGYSLSQCEDLSACLLFSSLCERSCVSLESTCLPTASGFRFMHPAGGGLSLTTPEALALGEQLSISLCQQSGEKKVKVLVTHSFPTLLSYELYPIRFLCPCGFPGKNTRVGCHFLLQRIFLTQGSNLTLLN